MENFFSTSSTVCINLLVSLKDKVISETSEISLGTSGQLLSHNLSSFAVDLRILRNSFFVSFPRNLMRAAKPLCSFDINPKASTPVAPV